MFLKVYPAFKIQAATHSVPWLIQDLWADQAVGIIGGEPKCCKSFLALSIAIAVASGTPCLGSFNVLSSGRVLYFPAEDSLLTVRTRIAGICQAQALDFATLPLLVADEPGFRLDVQSYLDRLKVTLEKYQPKLMILDPFVRLHGIDENISGEVAKLLGYLRCLQRKFKLAVILVHHSKKGASTSRPGQALRGSSDFHAWGDSNLYLSKLSSDLFNLTVEHRAQKACDPFKLKLVTANQNTHLQVSSPSSAPLPPPASIPLEQKILTLLAQAAQPLNITALRQILAARHQAVSTTVAALLSSGLIQKSNLGFHLPTQPAHSTAPTPLPLPF